MKIGVLSTSYPRHETDIAGCFVRDANREFAQRGHQVEVLIPEGELSRQNGSDDPTTVIEIPYLRPRSLQRTFHGSGVINNIASNPMRAIGALSFLPNLALKARQSAHHWDAIVSHWCLPCGLIGGQLATDLPHLVIFHSADVQLLEKLPLRRQLAAAILHGASALHFVAAHLKARFFALLSPEARTQAELISYVLPMGVHLPPTRRAEITKPVSTPLRVLTMSRLVPIKGLDDTVRACASLRDVELTCAGSGPEQEGLRTLAQRMRQPVRLPGTLVREAKAKALAEADIFIQASRPTSRGREEGVPTGLLEAMAAELPIIATRTGGITDILHDGHNALLVEPNHPRQLRNALERVRGDRDLATRLARQARQDVEAYEWSAVAAKMLSTLQPASGSNAPRPRGKAISESRRRHRSVESQL